MDKCKCGSYAINPHLHGRDNADLDLCDVCYWRKRANSLQQLKAEIRAIHDSLQEAAAENDTEGFEDCLMRLRDLSNIQTGEER